MYNLGLAADPDRHDLSGDLVWNAFYLHALLSDLHLKGQKLQLPHRCLQADRFTSALDARNYMIAKHGQRMWAHACDDCEKIIPVREDDPNGECSSVPSCLTYSPMSC